MLSPHLARAALRIAVPLRESDPDVPIDLQALIDLCHERRRYDDIDMRVLLNRCFRKKMRHGRWPK